jgi:hypothetical protein
MRRTLGSICVAVLVFAAGPAHSVDKSEGKYLCVGDRATGFHFNKATLRWEQASFNADEKLIVEPLTDAGFQINYKYKVVQVGEDSPLFLCKDGFNEAGYLNCEGGGEFAFNRQNSRFVRTATLGYLTVGVATLPPDWKKKVTDATSDTPFLEIGKCSPI